MPAAAAAATCSACASASARPANSSSGITLLPRAQMLAPLTRSRVVSPPEPVALRSAAGSASSSVTSAITRKPTRRESSIAGAASPGSVTDALTV